MISICPSLFKLFTILTMSLLAIRLHAPLATLDTHLIGAAKKAGIEVL
jgi:hypothetical protein